MLAFLVNCIMFSISFGDVDGRVPEESRGGGVYSFLDLVSKMFLLVWHGICISPGKAAYWTSLIWSRVRINKVCKDDLALFCIYDFHWILVCILLRERPIDAVLEYLIVGVIGILYFLICRCLRGGVAVLNYLSVRILRELNEVQAGCRTWVQGRYRQTPWLPFRLPLFVFLWSSFTLAFDWSIHGKDPYNESPGSAVSIYLGHAEPLVHSYGSTSLGATLGHGSCPGGVRLLIGLVGVAMLLCRWSWRLFRFWELLGRVCSMCGMEDEQLGGLDIDLSKHGRNIEGPVATYGSVTGRTLNNAGRGNCFWYAVSQLRFGHAKSWRKIKQQVLLEANQEIQKKHKAGGKWADEDAIQATADFLHQEIWVVNVGGACNFHHFGQVVRFLPTVQDQQIKPLVLRLWSNHFEAVQVNSIWLENCEVSWEAYKRSPFELCAPCSGLDDLHDGCGADLCGGGKGHKKGWSNSQFADIPGVTYDISRYLSFVLRHGADKEGIEMDSEGYVKVEDILARKPHASIDSVLLAVNRDEKGRFEVHQGEDGWLIRATQGHNKELDLSNEMHRQITTPDEVDQPTLFHGTYLAAWGSIRRQGLRCGHRQHVHFSTTYFVNHGQSGMRPGCDLVVAVNVQQLLDAEMPLYKSTNGVYLVGQDIPPELLYNVYWARGPHNYRMIWQYGYCVLHEEIVRDEVLAAKCRKLGLEPWGVLQPLEVDDAGEEEVKEEMEEMEEVLVENEDHEASNELDERQGSEEVADLLDQASGSDGYRGLGEVWSLSDAPTWQRGIRFKSRSRSPGGRPLHNSLRTPLPRRRPLPRLRRDISGAGLWNTDYTGQWRSIRVYFFLVCFLAYSGASGMETTRLICGGGGDEYSYYSTDDDSILQSNLREEPTKREPAWRKHGRDRRCMKVHFAVTRTFTVAPTYERPREGTPPPARTSGGDDRPLKRKRRKHKKIYVEDIDPRPPLPRIRRVEVWKKEEPMLGIDGRPALPRKRSLQGGMLEQEVPLDLMRLGQYLQLTPFNDEIRDLFPLNRYQTYAQILAEKTRVIMTLTQMSEAQVLSLKTACRKLMGKAVQQTRAKQFLDQEDERDVKDAVALATMHVSDGDQQTLVGKFVSWKIKPLHFIPESSPSTIAGLLGIDEYTVEKVRSILLDYFSFPPEADPALGWYFDVTGGRTGFVPIWVNSLGVGGGGEQDDESVTSDSSAFHMLNRCRDAQTAFDEAIQLQSTLRKRNRRLAKHLQKQQEVIEDQKATINRLRHTLMQLMPTAGTGGRCVGDPRHTPLGDSEISPTVPFLVDEGSPEGLGPDRFRDRSNRLATQPYSTASGRLGISRGARPAPEVSCEPIEDLSDVEGGMNDPICISILLHLCGMIDALSLTIPVVLYDSFGELSDLGSGFPIYRQRQYDALGTMLEQITGGGGAAEAEAIGKAQQKVMRAEVEFAPKQIRALLVLDSKLREKILSNDGQNQIRDMIRASAKKIGMQPDRSAPAPSEEQHPPKGKAEKGGRGKGNGKAMNQDSAKGKSKRKEDDVQERQDKGKGRESQNNAKGKGKKGKDSLPEPTFELIPEDWNCPIRSIADFNPSAHGLYLIQDAAVAQQLASKIKNDQFNISFIMPQPHAIGKKAPIEMQIRLFKTQGTFHDTVLLTGHLHTLSGSVPETGRKFIQTSTQVTQFGSEDRDIQNAIRQKQFSAIRQWMQHQLAGIELIDIWNLRNVDGQWGINARIPKGKLDEVLRKSSPVLEIDTPRDCPVTTRPVWLKREGLPLTVEQVLEFAKEVPNHYGIFKKQDCYALRVSQADFHKTKEALGQVSTPLFRIFGLPQYFVAEDVMELLQAMAWEAEVQPGSRRFRNGGVQYLVRSSQNPPLTSAPFFFGYERRVVTVEPTVRSVVPAPRVDPPKTDPVNYPSFKSQLQKGKGNGSSAAKKDGPSHSVWWNAPLVDEGPKKRIRIGTPTKSSTQTQGATGTMSRGQIMEQIAAMTEQLQALQSLLQSPEMQRTDGRGYCGVLPFRG